VPEGRLEVEVILPIYGVCHARSPTDVPGTHLTEGLREGLLGAALLLKHQHRRLAVFLHSQIALLLCHVLPGCGIASEAATQIRQRRCLGVGAPVGAVKALLRGRVSVAHGKAMKLVD
jgi:hypothetical protein